ncbi:uncharacterized protein TEOVI_000859700 [Trypanosoma equiperdum]|uniref:Uncharacterized protein n=1 Tax=Trypanosoma equiperdum TaxID=5694 RepID=A0A1G4I7E2_TRYEQ|nr:hypothetical protein, conserved [Trypanosoma equiperdum]
MYFKPSLTRYIPVCISPLLHQCRKLTNSGDAGVKGNTGGSVSPCGSPDETDSGTWRSAAQVTPIVLHSGRGNCVKEAPVPNTLPTRHRESIESRSQDVSTVAADGESTVPDHGPLRPTGLWKVEEVVDATKATVDFRRIDEVESEVVEAISQSDSSLVPYDEEEQWKHKLMFVHKFRKSPKHLTWRQLGEEIECMDCIIDMDKHRPEEVFTISFYFTDKKTGTRDVVWTARNDVSHSEGLTDLLAAIGACLGRADVHRTIRFDDGMGVTRDISIRKLSRYTSDVTVAFRPPEKYNKYARKSERDEYEQSATVEDRSTWGFHPALMDRDYTALDYEDPSGTYVIALSAHAFSYIILRCINRLLERPMKDFYRPSQLMRTAKVRMHDTVGVSHAVKGWMGIEELIYPHYTPVEAIQEHWLGKDAPFSIVAIINKLREMTYLKKENPELRSWLSVRHYDTHTAIRNLKVKMLGVGASSLFLPVSHNPTVNRLLPRSQQRRLESSFSLNAVLGMPDETRQIDEFKKITGCECTNEIGDTKSSTEKKDTIEK